MFTFGFFPMQFLTLKANLSILILLEVFLRDFIFKKIQMYFQAI